MRPCSSPARACCWCCVRCSPTGSAPLRESAAQRSPARSSTASSGGAGAGLGAHPGRRQTGAGGHLSLPSPLGTPPGVSILAIIADAHVRPSRNGYPAAPPKSCQGSGLRALSLFPNLVLACPRCAPRRSIAVFAALGVPAALVNSGLKYMQKRIELAMQMRLTAYLHQQYCRCVCGHSTATAMAQCSAAQRTG